MSAIQGASGQSNRFKVASAQKSQHKEPLQKLQQQGNQQEQVSLLGNTGQSQQSAKPKLDQGLSLIG